MPICSLSGDFPVLDAWAPPPHGPIEQQHGHCRGRGLIGTTKSFQTEATPAQSDERRSYACARAKVARLDGFCRSCGPWQDLAANAVALSRRTLRLESLFESEFLGISRRSPASRSCAEARRAALIALPHLYADPNYPMASPTSFSRWRGRSRRRVKASLRLRPCPASAEGRASPAPRRECQTQTIAPAGRQDG